MIALLISITTSLVIIIAYFETRRKWPRVRHQPNVTVVVAARDEETNIFSCLMSIATQDYPLDKMRLIVVNHLSKDRTGEIIKEFHDSNLLNMKVLEIKEEDAVLKGKVQALDAALELVETEIVLLTDADCVVPESWVRTLVGHFSDEVVAVGGMVKVRPKNKYGNWIARIQTIDHRFFFGIQAGLSGITGRKITSTEEREFGSGGRRAIPESGIVTKFRSTFCWGNNLAFRMSSYHSIGGYKGVGPSLIEDYALMQKMVHTSKKHLAIILDNQAAVTTLAQPDLRGLWQQKRRWATSTNIFDPVSYALYALIFGIRIICPWMIIFSPFSAIAALTLMGATSAVLIYSISRKLGKSIRLRDIVFHELYQIALFNSVLMALAVRWPIIWKGQKYKAG